MKKYDTFLPRLLAIILDTVLLLPLFILDDLAEKYALSTSASYAIKTATSFAGVFYFILLHYFFGQTVGKMLMKVKVLDVSEKPLRFIQAVLRDFPQLLITIVFLVFGDPEFFFNGEYKAAQFAANPVGNIFYVLLLVWGIADIIVFLRNEKRRALHDFVAGSVVVRVESDA